MQRHRAAAIVATTLFGLSACAVAVAGAGDEVLHSPSYPAYESVAELADAADLVIEGTILSSSVQELDIATRLTGDDARDPELNPGGPEQGSPSMMVFTVHEVQVERAIKGTAAEGSTIEVKELGGTLGTTRHITEGGVLLTEEQSYVMFLETYESSPANLLNPVQSVYERVDGELISLPGNTLVAEDVARLS